MAVEKRSMHYCSDWHGVLALKNSVFHERKLCNKKGTQNNIFNGGQWEYRINQKFES